MDGRSDRSVFINCPFDDDYRPILVAILFCIVRLGFLPRIATQSIDSGQNRLEKIRLLIEASRWSIHDLSRCQAGRKGEFYRLNMPFELGLDYGCRLYRQGCEAKRFLILEEKPFRYRAAISDLAGFDIQIHSGDAQRAVRKVRNWLVSETGVASIGAAAVLDAYGDFQHRHSADLQVSGFSIDDMRDYPVAELIDAMQRWVAEVGAD